MPSDKRPLKLPGALRARVLWARVWPAARQKTLAAVGRYLVTRGVGCYEVPAGMTPAALAAQHELRDWDAVPDPRGQVWVVDYLAVARAAARYCRFSKKG